MVGHHPVRLRAAQRRVVTGQTRLHRLHARLRRPSVRPGPNSTAPPPTWPAICSASVSHRVTASALWHKDSAAIHVALVAIERCGAAVVGLGSRVGVREAEQILRTTQPTLVVTDTERHAPARGRPPPPTRRCAWSHSARELDVDTHPRPDSDSGLSPAGPGRRLPDQLHVGHHRHCPNALCTRRTGGTTSTRRPSPTASSPRTTCSFPSSPRLRIRDLDLAHHADPSGRDDRPHRALRSRRDVRGDRAPSRDGVVLRQYAIGDDPRRPGIAGPRPEQPARRVHRRRATAVHAGGTVRGADRRDDPAVLRLQRDRAC